MNRQHGRGPTIEQAFAEGVRQGGANERRASRESTLEKQLAAERVAKAEALEAQQKANLSGNVARALLARGDRFSDTDVQRITNHVTNEHARCKKTGEAFDVGFATLQAVHKIQTKTDPTANHVAPIDPKGVQRYPGGGGTPESYEQRVADRERYRARLRELGLLDPATQSVPSGTT